MAQEPMSSAEIGPLRRKLREAAERIASSRIAPNKSFLHAKQRSLENWICIELALELKKFFREDQINLEVSYPLPSKGRCDLRVEEDGASLWVEVAHIWSWTQPKWDTKCRHDVQRGEEFLSFNFNQTGILILFLFSHPDWYQGEFEEWVHQMQNHKRIILINSSNI